MYPGRIAVIHSFTILCMFKYCYLANPKEKTIENDSFKTFTEEDTKSEQITTGLTATDKSATMLSTLFSETEFLSTQVSMQTTDVLKPIDNLARESTFTTPLGLGNGLTLHNNLDDKCYDYGICSLLATMSIRFCQCDEYCGEYRDCCLDWRGYIDMHVPLVDYMECHQVSHNENEGVFAVERCPPSTNDTDIIRKCHTDFNLTSGEILVVSEGIVFKNQFCAMCHERTNFTHFALRFRNVNLNPEEIEDYLNLQDQNRINFLIHLPLIQYRLIPPKNINARPCAKLMMGNNSTKCNGYVNPVMLRDVERNIVLYRNMHCLSTEDQIKGRCVGRRFDQFLKDSTLYDLSILFNFDKEFTNAVRRHEVEQDSVTCSGKDSYINFPLTTGSKTFDFPEILTRDQSRKLTLILAWTIQVQNVVSVKTIQGSTVLSKITKQSFTEVSVSIELIKELKDCGIRFYKNWLSTLQWEFNIQMKNKTDMTAIITDGIEEGYKSTDDLLFLMKCELDNHLAQFMSQPENNINTSGIMVTRFCDSILLDVTVQDVNWSAITITSLHCKSSTSANLNPENILLHLKISVILTYSAFSFSIVCLIINVVVITKLKITLTVPGCNMRNLSVAMILSEFVFMIGIGANEIHIICYIVGVVLHYLWLSVFFFITIAIVWISRQIIMLRPRVFNSGRNPGFTSQAITIFGLFLPLPCVGLALCLDQLDVVSVKYGGKVCFPAGFPGNIYFFTGPVLILLIINAISIGLTIIKMKRTRLDIGDSQVTQTTSSDTKIYTRLLVISSVVWVLGVINSIFKTEWLSLVFITLCGLQGTFITIANLSTQTILNRLRTRSESSPSTETQL